MASSRPAVPVIPALHMFACLPLRLALLAVAFLIPLLPASAQGVDIPNRRGSFTPGELALLPPYCSDMHGMPGYDGPLGDHWRSQMGEDFQHIHHYCRGLRDVFFARMATVSAQHRRFLWERSVNEYEYMLRNSRPGMPLIPEIFTRMGESLLQLGRLADAQAAFENARRLKPDYWPAYTAWADELMKLKQYKAARELLEQGLGHAPKSAELLSRLNKAKAGAGG